MSRPRKSDGWAPRQRKNLARPELRKRLHVELRPRVYARLLQMIRTDELGRPESMTGVVERLILSENGKLPSRNAKYVQTPPEHLGRVA